MLCPECFKQVICIKIDSADYEKGIIRYKLLHICPDCEKIVRTILLNEVRYLDNMQSKEQETLNVVPKINSPIHTLTEGDRTRFSLPLESPSVSYIGGQSIKLKGGKKQNGKTRRKKR